jgi:hypothetical protein
MFPTEHQPVMPINKFQIHTIRPIIPIPADSYLYHSAKNLHYWRQLFQ